MGVEEPGASGGDIEKGVRGGVVGRAGAIGQRLHWLTVQIAAIAGVVWGDWRTDDEAVVARVAYAVAGGGVGTGGVHWALDC